MEDLHLLNNSTPITPLGNEGVYVKREDLACPSPGPPFAKTRGLLLRLQQLKKRHYKYIGYVDTSISMASWGVSYFCKALKLQAVIYLPYYKNGMRHNQEEQHVNIKKFGGVIRYIKPPTMMSINYHIGKRRLSEEFPCGSIMLPQGLPFQETVHEVAQQVHVSNIRRLGIKSIVMCIGSGTMTAGVLLGCNQIKLNVPIYGVLVHRKKIEQVQDKVLGMSGFSVPLFKPIPRLEVIDYGYAYTQKEECACPFPCNPYYDRKAWKWLLDNYDSIEKPVLFWNIGA